MNIKHRYGINNNCLICTIDAAMTMTSTYLQLILCVKITIYFLQRAHRFWCSSMAVVLGLTTRDGGENRSWYIQ